MLRQQPDLFGEVASGSTTWRTLEAIDDAALERIATARAEARKKAWAEGMDPGFYVIDIDGTLVTSDSDFKQGAAATYKKGFGFYPMMSYLDATGEPLAAKLRPGNAGSGTAADYVEVLDASLASCRSAPKTMRSSPGPIRPAARTTFSIPVESARCAFVSVIP